MLLFVFDLFVDVLVALIDSLILVLQPVISCLEQLLVPGNHCPWNAVIVLWTDGFGLYVVGSSRDVFPNVAWFFHPLRVVRHNCVFVTIPIHQKHTESVSIQCFAVA